MRFRSRTFFVLVFLLYPGCDLLSLPRATLENYERIQVGMYEEEVLEILGTPGNKNYVERLVVGDTVTIRWPMEQDDRTIEIRFLRDPLLRAVVKEKRIRDAESKQQPPAQSADEDAASKPALP